MLTGPLKPRALIWLTAALVLALSIPARAQNGIRVVLLADPNQDMARHLLAEAKQAGLVLVPGAAETSDETPAKLAARYAAVGVLRSVTPSSVDLWLPNAEGNTSTVTHFRSANGEDDGFVVRVVEETRARLVALHLPDAQRAQPEPAETASNPEKAERVALAPSSPAEHSVGLPLLALGAGVAATGATGGMGVTFQTDIAARARVASRLGASLGLLLPLSRNDFSAAEGRGHARAYLFEAGLHWLTWQSQARFRIDTGAGAGLLWLPLRADAATGYLAKSDHLSAAVFFVNAALSVKLSPTLAIRTAVLGGLTAPRPRVQFGTREVAAWGRSYATAALGLELGFW